MRCFKTLKNIIYISVLLISQLAFADEQYCAPIEDITPPIPEIPDLELQLPILKQNQMRLFADTAFVQQQEGNLSTFAGNVLLKRDTQILSSEVMVYDNKDDSIDALTGFTYWDDNYVVQGERLKLLPNYQGEINNANYWLLHKFTQNIGNVRGEAEKVLQKNQNEIELFNTTYTTCDKKNEYWKLTAKETVLDKEKSVGVSRHVRIDFLDIPVFYTPYISYPLNDARKTGFLTPSFGTSDSVGYEYTIPYYLNLNPSYDATVGLRVMSKRGMLWDGEFRYLRENSGGKLNASYMSNDKDYGDKRASVSFAHNGKLFTDSRWYTDINYNYLSDDEYFEDLGYDLQLTSITHVERRGDLYYFGNGWTGLGRIQAYQTLTELQSDRPYYRAPQLLLKTNLPERNKQFNIEGHFDFNRFERDADLASNPTGNRIDLYTALSHPFRNPGSFIVPRLGMRYTRYDLDEDSNPLDDQINRFTWNASLDSGLIFDRDTSLFNTDLLQTLEPRLLYRYVSYEDQDNIPLFDTVRYDLTYSQLFRENSFSGADRVQDMNQVTLGVTTRLLEKENGKERLRASLGQIYYFKDRRVALASDDFTDITNDSSSLIGEISSQVSDSWKLSTTMRWNPHSDKNEYAVVRARYHDENKKRILNLAYRLRDDQLEQTDVSFHWALNRNWRILGRWNQSILHSTELETFVGVEYDSCCWAMRVVARRYLTDVNNSDFVNGIFVQFHLKGLGGVGKKADILLEQSIPGYYDNF
ncbi:LPS assembly protein LptD [Candidatus Albibeggiatoa sp. nov. NOAA]|uniref:LPS-assembly protein LptD n=1 Tax=Candidatus Albibeggiatoa sp. nov. NOAA TaxID=3162724 RepID=UPI0032FED35B|nr:LPS assembly protein LptD [Thiotrichaceae bacterium]